MKQFDQALQFAAEKHGSQYRKMSHLPYILHPMEVAVIASTMTQDEDVLVAALLHDTLEDTGVTEEDLRTLFGDRVTELVLSETENKRAGLPSDVTWAIRKEESLRILKETDDRDIRILWLSDKLSNLRSFRRQYETIGSEVWGFTHQKDPAKQEWYYRSIASCLSDLRDTEAYREYQQTLAILFGGFETESAATTGKESK